MLRLATRWVYTAWPRPQCIPIFPSLSSWAGQSDLQLSAGYCSWLSRRKVIYYSNLEKMILLFGTISHKANCWQFLDSAGRYQSICCTFWGIV